MDPEAVGVERNPGPSTVRTQRVQPDRLSRPESASFGADDGTLNRSRRCRREVPLRLFDQDMDEHVHESARSD
jgi:hypothetical protein